MENAETHRCMQHASRTATMPLGYALLGTAVSLFAILTAAAAAGKHNDFMTIHVNQSQYPGVTVAVICDTLIPLNTTTFPLTMKRDVLGKDSERWRFHERRSKPAPGGGKFYTLVYLLTVTSKDDGVRIDCIANLTTIGKGHPITAVQTHIQRFADPVLFGPRAVAVGATVTWTCDIARVIYTQRSDFSVYWTVINGSLSTENITTDAQKLDTGDKTITMYRVRSNATLYVSGKYLSYGVKCVAQHFQQKITKDTGQIKISVFMMDDPVLSGPTKAAVNTTESWTCNILTTSFTQRQQFTLSWFVDSRLQSDHLSDTRVTDTENKINDFPVPMHSVTSTLTRSLDKDLAPSFLLQCAASLVHLNVTKKVELRVKLTGDRIPENVGGGKTTKVNLETYLIILLVLLVLLAVLCCGACIFWNRRRRGAAAREQERTPGSGSQHYVIALQPMPPIASFISAEEYSSAYQDSVSVSDHSDGYSENESSVIYTDSHFEPEAQSRM